MWVLREGLNIGRVGAALSSVGSTCAIVTVELIITPPLVVGSVGQPAAVSGRATKLKRCPPVRSQSELGQAYSRVMTLGCAGGVTA